LRGYPLERVVGRVTVTGIVVHTNSEDFCSHALGYVAIQYFHIQSMREEMNEPLICEENEIIVKSKIK
jgi:hypothetical protein